MVIFKTVFSLSNPKKSKSSTERKKPATTSMMNKTKPNTTKSPYKTVKRDTIDIGGSGSINVGKTSGKSMSLESIDSANKIEMITLNVQTLPFPFS
jgi:hypothetical protein